MNPVEVIADFFDCNTIAEVRGQLDQLIRIALVTDNSHFSEPEERFKLLEFRDFLNEFIDAVYKLTTQPVK